MEEDALDYLHRMYDAEVPASAHENLRICEPFEAVCMMCYTRRDCDEDGHYQACPCCGYIERPDRDEGEIPADGHDAL